MTVAALVLAAWLSYGNSLDAPFVFDDGPAIVENASLRRLDRLDDVLWPRLSGGETVRGRPVANLSFALNYALTGENVGLYHATNVWIHVAAALALYGVVRRTLRRVASPSTAAAAPSLALATAGLWLLHPLQTESVTYIVQRTESLAGLFCLLTLYGFVRAVDASRPTAWLSVSVGACLLAMATKETSVAAPVLVLLYDRTFLAGTFRAAWLARKRYYIGLALTGLPLAALVSSTAGRGGTAGFDTAVSPWHYLLTQCTAIPRYLWLTVWPSPLVFDYGTGFVTSVATVALPGLMIIGLLAATAWGMVRRAPAGFLGGWFFACLAPSSSFVPVASQTMAEHRVYLALAAPVAALVWWSWRGLGRGAWPILAAGALALGLVTHVRNRDYRTEAGLWADTLAKRPDNSRAHHNVGLQAFKRGEIADAMREFEMALRLQPRAAESHYNLGLCYARLQRYPDALREYAAALALDPTAAETHINVGNALLALDRPTEARAAFEAALKRKPDSALALNDLSVAALQAGDAPAALQAAERAVKLQPKSADAHFNAGNACAELQRFEVARTHYETAIALDPTLAAAHHNLANVFLELDRPEDAISHLTRAVTLQPGYHAARRTLALVLMKLGRRAEALPHLLILAEALPGDPQIAPALREAKR